MFREHPIFLPLLTFRSALPNRIVGPIAPIRRVPSDMLLALMMSTLLLIPAAAIPMRGFSIAFAGLVIVFVALTLISLFIASLPRIVGLVANVWPEHETPRERREPPERGPSDDAAVLAAIGYVLHTEFQKHASGSKPET